MKLVADENIIGLEALPASIEVEAVPGRAIAPAVLVDADALWVRSVTPVDEKLLGGSGVRFVGTATAGVEHVDTQALERLGVSFTAAPGANAMAVVEYVLAALAACGDPWRRLEEGGVLGVLGFGHVGRRLVAFARAMGWRVRSCDPWINQDGAGDQLVSFEELLACDVISLHSSLHRNAPWPSEHLFDARALARLSADQWLINASRGAVIDYAALREHLFSGTSAQVVLDVWEGEPHVDWDLLAAPALHLCTPHIAGYSIDAKAAATQRLFEAMQDVPGLVPASARISWETVHAMRNPGTRPGLMGGPGAPWANDDPLDGIDAILASTYDIRADDRRFRKLLENPDPDARAEGFDRLRRDYPLRREVSALAAEAATEGSDAGPATRGKGLERTGGAAGERLMTALSAARDIHDAS